MLVENMIAVVVVMITLVCQLLGVIHLNPLILIFMVSWLGFGGILWLTK